MRQTCFYYIYGCHLLTSVPSNLWRAIGQSSLCCQKLIIIIKIKILFSNFLVSLKIKKKIIGFLFSCWKFLFKTGLYHVCMLSKVHWNCKFFSHVIKILEIRPQSRISKKTGEMVTMIIRDFDLFLNNA